MARNRHTEHGGNEDAPSSPVKARTTKPVKTLPIAGTKRAREAEVDIADRVCPPFVQLPKVPETGAATHGLLRSSPRPEAKVNN